MDLLFHTIAIEPARWTAQRTSQDLVSILPGIAAAGFRRIEVYEPHLATAAAWPEIRDSFAALGLAPEILSSYLNLNPAVTSDAQFEAGLEPLRARVDYYGFRAVRIFPGPKMKPADKPGISLLVERLRRLADGLPGTAILLETHDGSVADDPETITQIVRELDAPTVALLYQPTIFEPEAALRQLAIQKPFIRHVHLQNRFADGSFAPLRDGVIPWDRILAQLDKNVTATLEFVPAGICPIEKFDLAATLLAARSEAAYVREVSAQGAATPVG